MRRSTLPMGKSLLSRRTPARVFAEKPHIRSCTRLANARLLRTIESLPVAPAGAPGCSRDSPTEAVFLSRTRLNKPGSEKETWHVEIDLAESRLDYVVGDSFGVFPTNDPALADAVIA